MTLINAESQPVLRFERRLNHPIERVWTALTDPAELAHWFPATIEAELRVGAPVKFTFGNLDVAPSTGEIIEFEPPRIFAYRWEETMLRWELVPEGDGCRLLFTQTLNGTAPSGDIRSAARHAAGWDLCLDTLAARLDGRSGDSVGAGWFERYEQYMETFGLGRGEVHETPDGSVVRFERDLVASVADAWAALVDGAEPVVGGPVPPGATPLPAGPVTEVDRPTAFAFEWRHEDEPAGELRWQFSGPDMFARLVLTQTVPARLAGLRPTLLATWHHHLELFDAALHDVRREWSDERVAALERSYESNSQ